MTTQNWTQLKHIPPAYHMLKEQGLTEHLEELDAYGLTVIPPEKIGDDRILGRMRKAVLRIAEEDNGEKYDVETGAHGTTMNQGTNNSQHLLYGFLEKDQVFEEIIQHPMTLPLMEYYLGEDCQLSSLTCFIKWQDPVGYGENLGLHDDSGLYPGYSPLPAIPHVFNTNWILTDYTKDNGAFCIVPGSHKLCRHPEPGEGVEDAVPVEAPAGSVLVFHGNVWHGAFPKLTPGLRLSVNAYYVGPHYRLQENFHGRISEEMLARNGVRFQELVNYGDHMGWQDARGPVPWHMREKIWDTLDDNEKKAVFDANRNRKNNCKPGETYWKTPSLCKIPTLERVNLAEDRQQHSRGGLSKI